MGRGSEIVAGLDKRGVFSYAMILKGCVFFAS
jgi:hypothetical protein